MPAPQEGSDPLLKRSGEEQAPERRAVGIHALSAMEASITAYGPSLGRVECDYAAHA